MTAFFDNICDDAWFSFVLKVTFIIWWITSKLNYFSFGANTAYHRLLTGRTTFHNVIMIIIYPLRYLIITFNGTGFWTEILERSLLNCSAILILPSSCNKIKIKRIFNSLNYWNLSFCFSCFTGIPPEFIRIHPFMLVKYLISHFEFAKFDCSNHTMSFFILIPFARISRLTTRLKNKNYLRIKITFFFFQTSAVFFKPSFKYHVVFQDRSEARWLRSLYWSLQV